MTQTFKQKLQTRRMYGTRHAKTGVIKWDNELLDQLCAITGESKMGLTNTIKELADGLGIELPRWQPKDLKQ